MPTDEDNEEKEYLRTEFGDIKLVSDYTRLDFEKVVELDCFTFRKLFRDAFIDKLAEQTGGKYTGVYGIPRAGLLLAILYSYRTNVPLLLAPYPGCLVIDDDIGTGLTMKPYVGKYDTAVMYSRPECEVVPTYIGAMYDNETYRVFAWNKEEDLRW